jgi:4'-phosphopantetheinyl transferase
LGRPEIAAPALEPRLRFSLSHTRGIVACAIAREIDVGFDVEDLSRDAPLEVAERFAPSERDDIASLGSGDREERLFIYWTLKEAYAKARGLGLSLHLDQTTFDLRSNPIRVSFGPECNDDEKAWHFASWRIEGAHRAGLAVRARDVELDVEGSGRTLGSSDRGEPL